MRRADREAQTIARAAAGQYDIAEPVDAVHQYTFRESPGA